MRRWVIIGKANSAPSPEKRPHPPLLRLLVQLIKKEGIFTCFENILLNEGTLTLTLGSEIEKCELI